MIDELKLTKKMSDKGIGARVFKALVFRTEEKPGEVCYGTAMLMAKMDGDLQSVIDSRKIAYRVNPLPNMQTLAKTLIRSVHLLANDGYMCADIKPENILIKGNVAYMADFDTKFCGKGSFLDRIVKKYGIKKPTITPSSWKYIRSLYSRAILFLLIKFITRWPYYRNWHGLAFIKALTDEYEAKYVPKRETRKIIFVGGKQVPAMDVLRYSIPGFISYNSKTNTNFRFNVFNMAKHYHRKANGTPIDIWTGQLYTRWFGSFM
jgi:hypothetical protein